MGNSSDCVCKFEADDQEFAKVSLAKGSLAKVSFWPKCHSAFCQSRSFVFSGQPEIHILNGLYF